MSDASTERSEGMRWRHALRNELNTITMANAAAVSLLDHGAPLERVREHLMRAEAACRRCSELVRDPDKD